MGSKDSSNDEPKEARRGFLEPKEIKRLIGILSAAGGLELELEDQGTRLRIRMPEPGGRTEIVQVPSPYGAPFVGSPQAPGAEAAPAAGPAAEAAPPGTVPLKSPMVGTFYRSPAPDADAFVNVGDTVGPDSTVCILEAMKVMNEIKAEQAGEVVQILVENGEPVEFGQPLMLLKPR